MFDSDGLRFLKYHYGLEREEEIQDKISTILQEAMRDDIPESLHNHPALAVYPPKQEEKTFTQSFLTADHYWEANTSSFQCGGPILKIFQNLGEILTELCNERVYFYYLDPDAIYLFGTNIYFPWGELDHYATEVAKPFSRIKKAPYSVAKPLQRGSIAQKDLTPYLPTYTLAYLLYRSLTPPHLIIKRDSDLMAFLSYLGTCNEMLPLDLKELLLAVITGEERGLSPLAFVKRVKSLFIKDRQRKVPYQPLQVEVDHYKQLGMKKEQQEDQSFVSSTSTSALLMVADGVSKATIGTGRLASTTALDCLEEQRQTIQRELSQLDSIASSSLEEWQKKASSFLESLYTRIQHALIERLNSTNKNRLIKPTDHIMSTTLNIAVITGNWVMVSWMGDSPAFIFNKDRLSILIEPHIQIQSDVKALVLKERKNLQREEKEGALTRYLPYSLSYNEERRHFEGDNPKDIAQRYFHLMPGDLFFMGSDGIVDCLKGYGAKEKKDRLAQLLQQVGSKYTNLRGLTYEVTKRIVEENGFDNVSMVAARISQHKGGKNG